MTEPRLGVLAEDDTDGETLRVLTRRILNKPRLAVEWRAENGCGALRRKAERWMRDLALKGCTYIIILHDLDRGRVSLQVNNERHLRKTLNGYTVPDGVRRFVCIPIEELEAWFWSDPNIIRIVGRGAGKAHPSPERLADPKGQLIRLSKDGGGKPRYSTNENPKLAEKLDIDTCAAKCPSFRALRSFLVETTGT